MGIKLPKEVHNVAETDSAAPEVVVVPELPEKSSGSDPVALAKVVHGTALSGPRGTRWKWTKRKREAFKLIMQGAGISETADRVKAHRNSIMLWMKAPEWMAEAQKYVTEAQVSTKLRRIKMASVIADQLGAKSLKALAEDDLDVGKTGLVLREHLNYLRAERDLFGEEAGGGGAAPGGHVHIHVGAPGQPQPVDDGRQATAMLSFIDFMQKYDQNLAVMAHSPQHAAALLAEKTLQESSLIDTIREEDREAMRKETEAAEAAKRRR